VAVLVTEAYRIIRSASLPALQRGGDTTGLVSSEGKSIVDSALNALASLTAAASPTTPQAPQTATAQAPPATPAVTAGAFTPTVPAGPSLGQASTSDPGGYHAEAARIIRTAKDYYKQRLLDEREIDGAPDGGAEALRV